MKTNLLFILIVTLISTSINAQVTTEKTIDSFVNQTMHRFKEIPSIAITIIKDDKPLFTKSYGYIDIEKGIKATNTSSYYIASVTKSFVGMLAAQLEHEGILYLNNPITDYAPIKNFKDKSLYEGVTINDLLAQEK